MEQLSETRKTGRFDIYWIGKERLLVGRFKGILDVATATQVIEFVETKEMMAETGFNRFCDFTYLNRVHLSCEEVAQLAARRREFNPDDIIVKSAFYAKDPLSSGIARMYEQILQSPRIEVRVFDDMQKAATWLGVDLTSLMH